MYAGFHARSAWTGVNRTEIAMTRCTKEDALQTRNALIDAAELVFESRGVAGTALQEVAETAGVTRGAVYWHFKDKVDLFNAMMDRAILPFEQQWLAASPDDATEPLVRLRSVLCDILRTTATDSRLQRVLAISTQKVEYVGEINGIRDRHLRIREQALRRIEGLLRLAAKSQQLAPGVSVSFAARMLHALVDGLISNWMLDRSAFDLRRVGQVAVEQLLCGLSCPGSSVRPGEQVSPGHTGASPEACISHRRKKKAPVSRTGTGK
jgi:TetR/AcrR family acrAB operon transcriptional repressor